MRWLRSHIKFGSWCGIVALAVQMVVSFGHAHRADFGWSAWLPPGIVLAAAVPDAAQPNAPSPSKPPGIVFDYCAICAVMNLAASAVPVAAPGLPVPIALGQIRFWATPDISLAELPHLLFQARAPPLA